MCLRRRQVRENSTCELRVDPKQLEGRDDRVTSERTALNHGTPAYGKGPCSVSVVIILKSAKDRSRSELKSALDDRHRCLRVATFASVIRADRRWPSRTVRWSSARPPARTRSPRTAPAANEAAALRRTGSPSRRSSLPSTSRPSCFARSHPARGNRQPAPHSGPAARVNSALAFGEPHPSPRRCLRSRPRPPATARRRVRSGRN